MNHNIKRYPCQIIWQHQPQHLYAPMDGWKTHVKSPDNTNVNISMHPWMDGNHGWSFRTCVRLIVLKNVIWHKGAHVAFQFRASSCTSTLNFSFVSWNLICAFYCLYPKGHTINIYISLIVLAMGWFPW
jgi:hypothetical protein